MSQLKILKKNKRDKIYQELKNLKIHKNKKNKKFSRTCFKPSWYDINKYVL